MAEVDCSLNLYKAPSNEILQHRKEFHGMWKRFDDEPTIWLDRLQSQFNRCDFPLLMSREYILIDRFVCELNDDEREFIQSVNTWTLMELNEYFLNQKTSADNLEMNATNTADETIYHKQRMPSSPLSPPSVVAIKCEFVSSSKTIQFFMIMI